MAAAEDEIRAELRADAVLLVTLNRPAGNALGREMRAALIAALAAAPGQGAKAVVLAAEGRHFSSATALEAGEGAPSLADLCRAVEDAPLPVVAALKGVVSGPGADLALAAHGRVARSDLRLSFPEIGLGLVPSGGATQRLPRLIGMAESLRLLVQARPMAAEEALAVGLIDVLSDGPGEADLLARAVALALQMPEPRPVRDRTEGLLDFASNHAALAAARHEAKRSPLLATQRLVDCLAAALILPFDNGIALEAVTRQDLEGSEQSQALIAAAQAERRASTLPPAVAALRPAPFTRLGLAGSSAQMAPLAAMALAQGLQVQWTLPDEAARVEAGRWIADFQAGELRAGRLSDAQRDADAARLSIGPLPDLLDGVGLVIHAAAGEDQARLTRWLPSLPHLVCGGAETVLGLSLAPSMRLAELALPPQVEAAHVGMAVQVIRRLGLVPVLEGKMPVLGRRVGLAGRRALQEMLAMGVPRQGISAALEGFGQSLPDLSDPEVPPPLRAMAEPEILRRWLGAMANEGMRLLDLRVALRPSDIDVVMALGFGFPRLQGGVMYQAGRRGLMVLRRDLRAWAEGSSAAPLNLEAASLWSPHPLIDRLIGEGRRLSDLD